MPLHVWTTKATSPKEWPSTSLVFLA